MPRIPRLAPGQVIPLRVRPEDLGTGRGDYASARTADEFANVAASIAEAEISSRADRFVAEQTKAAYDLASQLEQDPDYDTAEERFTEATGQMLEEGKKSFRGLGRERIASNLEPMLERARFGLQQSVQKRRVEQAAGDYEVTAQTLAELRTLARSPDEIAAVDRMFAEATGRAQGSGVLNPAQAAKRVFSWEQDNDTADALRLVNEDPEAAAQMLREGVFPRIGPERREVLIGRADSAAEVALRKQEVAVRRQEAQAKEAEKQAARDANRQLTLKAAPSGAGITEEDVLQHADILTPEDSRSWLNVVGNGGKLRDGEPNPKDYSDLVRRAGAGDPTAVSDAEKLYQSGNLNKTAYDQINSAAEVDNVYKDQIRFLRTHFDVGEAQLDRDDVFIAKTREAQAERAVRTFLAEKPTQADAWDYVEKLSQSVPFVNPYSLSVAQLPPPPEFVVVTPAVAPGKNTPGKPSTIDTIASMQLLKDAFDAGQIDQLRYDEFAERLRRIKRAQGE